MLQGRGGDVAVKISVARERLAVEQLERRRERPIQNRRPAAVDVLVVNFVLIAEMERGSLAEPASQGGIDAVALHPREVAERVGVLVHRVHTKCGVGRNGLTDIDGATGAVPTAELHGALIDGNAVGPLRDAVDDATAAAAAEDHGERPLQHLDGLGVVEIAEGLDVVAHAVDKEVPRGLLAAEAELVPVALALLDGNARDIAQGLAEQVGSLVLRQLLGDDGHRAGDVHDEGVGLGRRGRAGGVIAVHAA